MGSDSLQTQAIQTRSLAPANDPQDVVIAQPGIKWRLLWPLRQYLIHAPSRRGKGFLRRNVLIPSLPAPPYGFVSKIEPWGEVCLWYREILGFSTLMSGGFETEEIRTATNLAKSGTTAIDVGANVGLFTIPLAKAIGAKGTILAFEPLPNNVRRLNGNIRRNNLDNVVVLSAAASTRSGRTVFHLGQDPAYSSLVSITEDRMDTGATIEVETVTLDDVWSSRQRPEVSLIKLDVEGGEFDVLGGSTDLLRHCRPHLLVETNSSAALKDWLAPFNYVDATPAAFKPNNHLYAPA